MASAVAFVLTLVWEDWIDVVCHVDPDGSSGAAELVIVAGTGGRPSGVRRAQPAHMAPRAPRVVTTIATHGFSAVSAVPENVSVAI